MKFLYFTIAVLISLNSMAQNEHDHSDEPDFGFSEKFNAEAEEIETLEEALKNPSKVMYLSLNCEGMKEFPNELLKFTNLEKLDLYKIPENLLITNLGKLVNLKWIGFGGKIKELPVDITLLKELRYIEVVGELEHLPEDIGNLTNLQVLKLENNKLTSIPVSIGGLVNLKELNLNQNKLTKLPTSIGNLKELRVARFSSNLLTTAPSEIGNLGKLSGLFLAGNKLSSIPATFCQLKHLEALMIIPNNSIPETEIKKISECLSIEIF